MQSFRNIMLRLCFGAGVFSLCAGCGRGIRQPERNEWLRATEELVDEMCEVATCEEAVGWMTSDSALGGLIRQMGDPTYDEPKRGWVVEMSGEELFGRMATLAETEPAETRLPEVMRRRVNPSAVVSMLNSKMSGTLHLAAGTMLTTRKTYIQPRDWTSDFLLILDYDQPYAVAAAFWESGEKTVTGTVCFVPEGAEKILKGMGIGKIRGLSDEDLKGESI